MQNRAFYAPIFEEIEIVMMMMMMMIMISISILLSHTLSTGRKLEEKKLKCKQAIDTAEKIKKENILIKNEVK